MRVSLLEDHDRARSLLLLLLALEVVLALVWVVAVVANAGLSTFSWHPILMCLGCVVLFAEGVNQFRARHFLGKDPHAARQLHGACQAVGGLCVLGGYGAIFAAHYPDRLVSPSTPLRTVHVGVGYAVVGGACVQLVSGLQKAAWLSRAPPETGLKWHGTLGAAVFALGLVNVLVAGLFEGALLGTGVQAAVVVGSAVLLGLHVALPVSAHAGERTALRAEVPE